jgi:STE24 endopeptidase
LPGYRYVLLTDALIESLTPLECAAVFGHEIGHIAHRHLLYFGFFFMGSLGILSILGELVAQVGSRVDHLAWLTPWTPAIFSEIVQSALLLGFLGLYFWLVFGQISRRFERQADVFGSKVVSCDLAECPPHVDLDHDLAAPPPRGKKPSLCPVGIRIFADALANVARGNGLDPEGRSWRHGSIARRIGFLEQLELHPDREWQFQRGVTRLRIGLGLVLVAAIVISVLTQLG